MSHVASNPIEVLDGALGTVLEDLPAESNPVSSSLWSAGLLKSSPEILKDVNTRYIRSGADIIETATYQCSYEGFEENGVGADEAERLMRLAVAIARDAIEEEKKVDTNRRRNCKLALSLGPFGATLRPGCEYSGIYPSPFNQNLQDPQLPQKHLKKWHQRRLDVFLHDNDTWDKVDIIAFETVPRLDELIAIREIMEKLESIDRGKPWWISCVFPDGKFPDGSTISDIFAGFRGSLGKMEQQKGIGINCTKLKYVPDLLEEFQAAYKRNLESEVTSSGYKPTLVLYPDGGQTYDPVSRTWSDRDEENESGDSSWAASLINKAQEMYNTGNWEKVIVGGCCKAVYDKIQALRKLVDESKRI